MKKSLIMVRILFVLIGLSSLINQQVWADTQSRNVVFIGGKCFEEGGCLNTGGVTISPSLESSEASVTSAISADRPPSKSDRGEGNKVNEKSSASYTATTAYSDGSTKEVMAQATWSVSSPSNASNYAAITSGDHLTTKEVSSRQTITITDSYTEGGISTQASKTVTINDQGKGKFQIVGSCPIPGYIEKVAILGNYAYASDWNGVLFEVIDLSNPESPYIIASYKPENSPRGLAVSGKYAYLGIVYDNLFKVIDVSNPASPSIIGSCQTPGGINHIAISGNYAYGAGDYGLYVIDISSPTSPFLCGSYKTNCGHGIAVSGQYAYLADGYGGLKVFDISNPTDLIQIGACDLSGVWEVAIAGPYAYVVMDKGLVVIDIRNPRSPYVIASCDTPGNGARSIAISGQYAYLADGISGLHVIDISNPQNPRLIDSLEIPNGECVAIDGNYGVVGGYGNFYVIDISSFSPGEICDGQDNDGDGVIPADEADADQDGYMICEGDCNDANPAIHPAASEGCNGLDDDCDGVIPADEADADQDGYMICEGDCNDANPAIHPAASEGCNGLDDDCDGVVDESCGCAEDDSGVLDVGDAKGRPGDEVEIPVRIQWGAPQAVYSFGFELTYDPEILEYQSYGVENGVENGAGNLLVDFFFVGVSTPSPGRIRVAGLDNKGIAKGASGTLVWLKFKVKGSAGNEGQCYSLNLNGLEDDIRGFSTSGGCFCLKRSIPCTGDLNGDGKITPADALIPLRCYLGTGPCPECADVDDNGQVSPADSCCLFKKYLGQPSCLD